ncbi:hypothetical protein [Bailinhaonella thermotolerans]|uniref:DoxX family membrane protein n=1 Tax=Bailinhaonella thermotolerans TaxID=1070861 RepID=A0A3A4A9I4_9ACTN|nr:hypothetical protein [Bailinhaonella thermotolerans]RJL24801.1 hypothetical protein D5H75_28895 [Bailinhaonella thermotolerans]
MRFFARAHQMPARIATGLFILNSGMEKAEAGEETAQGVHGMAAGAYPQLKSLDPVRFTSLVAKAEIGLGAALLAPFVPSLLAGTALAGFAAGLLGVYLRTPGLRHEGSLRPTQQGIGIAKDVWLLGIGVGLMAEEALHRRR